MHRYADNERSRKRQNIRKNKRTARRGRTVSGANSAADLIGQSGAWNFDEFDVVPYLMTQIPSWADSGLALDVELESGYTQRFGPEGSSAIRVRLRNDHYSAVVNGKDVLVRGDGNCFFYAVWEALQDDRHETAAQRIFNGREPLTRHEAAQYFRDAIKDYVERNPERFREIAGSQPDVDEAGADIFVDAPDNAEWLPEHFLRAPDASASERAASTELSRTLFHVGNQATEWLGYSALTRFVYQQLVAFSPLLSVYTSFAVSAYRLVNALIRRDLLDGLMQTLLMLPYQLLSPQTCLFVLAEETKRYIDGVLGRVDSEVMSEDDEHQHETIYMWVGIAALITQYLYFYRREMAFPRSALGKRMLGMIAVLKRAAQGYAVLQTLVDAVPLASTTDVYDPHAEGHDPQAGRMPLSAAEKKIQKQEKRARVAAAKSEQTRLRTSAETSGGESASPASTRSTATDATASKPLIVVGALVASHTIIHFGSGDAAAMENSALLVNEDASVIATSAGVQSLVRKSPLAGAVVGTLGAAAAAGYGLYRLVIWLAQSHSAKDIPEGVSHLINATSSVQGEAYEAMAGEGGRTAVYGTADSLVSSALHASGHAVSDTDVNTTGQVPVSTQLTTETASQKNSEPTAALGSAYEFPTPMGERADQRPPSGVELEDMADDFIVTVTRSEIDFLTVPDSEPPGDAGLTAEERGLILYRSEQQAAKKTQGGQSARVRNRRSAEDDAGASKTRAVTSELDSWVRENWLERDSIVTNPADDWREIDRNIYKDKNGRVCLYVGGNYWEIQPKEVYDGELKNAATGDGLSLQRSRPDFIWGFTETDRKRLGFGALPEADIPKPAVVSPDLVSWVAENWGAGSLAMKPGGVRFSDGLYEDEDGNLFLNVGRSWWRFSFMADRKIGKIHNQKNEIIDVKFDGVEWRQFNADDRRGQGVAGLLKKGHVIEGLFSYKVYSNDSNYQLKKIIQTVLAGKDEIKYSELLFDVRDQLDGWFAKEFKNFKSQLIAEIMLAKSEVANRIAHLSSSGRDGNSEDWLTLWSYYNSEVQIPMFQEYRNSLSLRWVDEDAFEEALSTTEDNSRYVSFRRDVKNRITRLDTEMLDLEERNGFILAGLAPQETKMKALQDSLDEIIDGHVSASFFGEEQIYAINAINAEIESLKKKYGLDKAGIARGVEKIQAKREEIRSLEQNLEDYNNDVRLEEERLTTYRHGIALARQDILDVWSKTNSAEDFASCSRVSRVAYLYSLFKQSSVRMKLLGDERANYTQKDVEELDASDVATKYLYEFFSLTQNYIRIVSRLDVSEINKIILHGDYRDILAAQREAVIFYSENSDTPLKGVSGPIALDAYYDLSKSDESVGRDLISVVAVIYAIMKDLKISADCREIHSDRILVKFLSDKKAMGPLGTIAKKPEGYISLWDFKSSDNFYTQQEFTDQFVNYVDLFSKHEADLISTSLMISSGLTAAQIYGNFRNFYKLKFWDVLGGSEVPGGLAFVRLENYDWLLIACLPNAMVAKYIGNREMGENVYLKSIRDNPYRRQHEGNNAWFDLYDYDFNMNYPDEKITKERNYERWHDLRDKLIVPLLGENSFSNENDRPLVLFSYKSSMSEITEGPLLSAVRDFSHKNIKEIAEASKSVLYKPSFWQQLALSFVPFYAEIYSSQTDRKYTPNVSQLIFDSLTVFAALGSTFLSAVSLTRDMLNRIAKMVWTARKTGLSGGPLIMTVVRELPRLGLMTAGESARIIGWGLYDLLEPVPLKTAFGPVFNGLAKLPKFKNGAMLNDVADTVFGPPPVNAGEFGSINSKWQRKDITLDGMIEGGGPFDSGIYSKPVSGSSISENSFNYIEIDRAVYQVRWDNYASTWRVIDPAHPKRLNHAVPVRLDDDRRWVVHNGSPTQRKVMSPVPENKKMERLKRGDVQPLMGSGLLFGEMPDSPGIDFDFVRSDSIIETAALSPQKFSMAEIDKADGRLRGAIEVWGGGHVTSKSRNGPVMGLWGDKNLLDDNVKIIEISNGQSGTVGVRILLEEIQEGHPIIISAGELSGCTMIYAVDADYFYAFHFGQKAGDSDWLTSRDGAASFYKAHLSLGGKPFTGLRINNGILTDDHGAPLRGNDALVDILSNYHKSTINYFGKYAPDGTSTRTTKVKSNVNQFDYNRIDPVSRDPRVGIAYALLTKDRGKVKVSTYSEDMSIGARKEKPDFKVLANSDCTIKDFDEKFDARKIEPVRRIDESTVPRGEMVDHIRSLLNLAYEHNGNIAGFINSQVDNSMGAVRRLWDLLKGRENSEFVKSFDVKGMPQEKAERIEELRDFISDPRVSVYIRAINYWEEGGIEWVNGRHFALILDATNVKFVLDPTAGQFAKFDITGPLLEVEEEWVSIYQTGFANTEATVKYKDFPSYEAALAFSPPYPVDARTFVDDAFLLREADWYGQAGAGLADVAPTVSASTVVQPESTPSANDRATSHDSDRPLASMSTPGADQGSGAVSSPAQTGYGRAELRDTTLAGGLIHFFSFDNGLADAITPGVSLRPFGSLSTTTEVQIDDNFDGKALQVSSLNNVRRAVNRLKLVDDVSAHPQFSIGFWFKSDGVQHHAPILCNKDWGAALNPGFVIDQQNTGLLKFNVADGSKRVDGYIPFTINAWVYVAIAFDTIARTATVYVGDPSRGLQTATLSLDGMDMRKLVGVHSTIGLNEDARGDYYSRYGRATGTMAFNDLAMWNKALAPEQVQLLFTSGRSLSTFLQS
ncbi:hypothetical protein R70006_06739 [Paraburkholderia domus]|uniref:cytotoxic necrotizing factor Rho-activating domain-containing protein n=1 Tax=Paraburkholderia domus TaxID=2793075 RepID=UPI00191250A7|nr:cytotoxic necrotizing factor Rho-activating domain-containing protein [Paraburkholderia domus]MBK5053277.1 hypothetical protein [Burkholderia sp. R-70006]CAE6832828.1 hypothetical protein R70006_06739 [Paraburkholderia domus]